MKKVVILSSSPRRGGNSDTICDEFYRGANDVGHKVDKIFLRDKQVNFCTGCGACSSYGKPCPQKDDMPEVLQRIIDADVVVMATPVYFYTMSAQMKTVIDRCCSRYTEIRDKEFYFIITAAEDDQPKMERTLDTFQGFLDCLENPVNKGVVYGLGVWHVGDIKGHNSLIEAYNMGLSV
ncbi:MAG: flavodoxin family protein [Bacteroidales bacterium]